MPQNIDSNYDALVGQYAEIEADRLYSCNQLYDFALETLIDRFENMTENELIEHVAEMGDEEIIESIYGNYPVDPDQEIEGRDYHQYSLKEGETISFPVHSDTK